MMYIRCYCHSAIGSRLSYHCQFDSTYVILNRIDRRVGWPMPELVEHKIVTARRTVQSDTTLSVSYIVFYEIKLPLSLTALMSS